MTPARKKSGRKKSFWKYDLVLACIRMFHCEHDCDPSFIDIMSEVECSPATISKALKYLEAKGSLVINRSRGHSVNHYRIIADGYNPIVGAECRRAMYREKFRQLD